MSAGARESALHCPHCGEPIHGVGGFCRYCSASLDAVAPPPPPPALPPWYRSWFVRGPVLAVFVVIAGLLMLDPGDWITDPIPVRIAVGVLVGASLLLFWGTLAWLVARLLHRRPPYWRVIVSFPLVTAVALGVIGQSLARDDPPGTPGILSPRVASAEALREKAARERFADWYREVARAGAARDATTRRYRRWAAQDAADDRAALRTLRRAERGARETRQIVAGLEPTPATRRATQLLRRGARRFVACVAGTRRLVLTLNLGDVAARRARINASCGAADRTLRAGDDAAAEAFVALGGRPAFPGLEAEVQAIARG